MDVSGSPRYWVAFPEYGSFFKLDEDDNLWTLPMMKNGTRGEESEGCAVDFDALEESDRVAMREVERALQIASSRYEPHRHETEEGD